MNYKLNTLDQNFLEFLEKKNNGSLIDKLKGFEGTYLTQPEIVIASIRNITEQAVSYLFSMLTGYKRLPFRYVGLVSKRIDKDNFKEYVWDNRINLNKAGLARQSFIKSTSDTYRNYANIIRIRGNQYTHYDSKINHYDPIADAEEMLLKFVYIINKTNEIISGISCNKQQNKSTHGRKISQSNSKNNFFDGNKIQQNYKNFNNDQNRQKSNGLVQGYNREVTQKLRRERAKYYEN